MSTTTISKWVKATELNTLYDQWCKETKRNGAVLIGGSMREFFEWLEEKEVPATSMDQHFEDLLRIAYELQQKSLLHQPEEQQVKESPIQSAIYALNWHLKNSTPDNPNDSDFFNVTQNAIDGLEEYANQFKQDRPVNTTLNQQLEAKRKAHVRARQMTVPLMIQEICSKCNGFQVDKLDASIKCPECKGNGFVAVNQKLSS